MAKSNGEVEISDFDLFKVSNPQELQCNCKGVCDQRCENRSRNVECTNCPVGKNCGNRDLQDPTRECKLEILDDIPSLKFGVRALQAIKRLT